MIRPAPSDVIAQLLIDKGVGWPVVSTGEPDSPDEFITVYDPIGRAMPKDIVGITEHYGIQVRVRSRTHDPGREKIADIANTLDTVSFDKVTISSARYVVETVIREGTINSLGREQGGERRLFTVNCLAVIRLLE